MTTPKTPNLAATRDVQLRLVVAFSGTLCDLEGQDRDMVLQGVEKMLDDIICEGDLAKIETYVRSFCDVMDNPGSESLAIEAAIWERMQSDMDE